MKILRVAFLGVTFLLAALALFWLRAEDDAWPRGWRESPRGDIGFLLTGVSGGELVAQDSTGARQVTVHDGSFTRETELASDRNTSFEFIFAGGVFAAMPGSRVRLVPQTRELYLNSGEFFWTRKVKGAPLQVSLLEPGNVLEMPDSGRIRLRAGMTEIFAYTGKGSLTWGGTTVPLAAQQVVVWRANAGKPQLLPILPGSETISPEVLDLTSVEEDGAVVPFKWKVVPGCTQYVLRFYSSPLRENLLLSRTVSGSGLDIDLLTIGNVGKCHWEVLPYDAKTGYEGAPSRMGTVSWTGTPRQQGGAARPPVISIDSLSVSGNMVLLRGQTDPACRFSIDGAEIRLDNDGKFIHTLSFDSSGTKEILIKAVSPGGGEAVLRRQVVIFDE
ncbi:MAG TPA: hypothetical protein PKK12_04845 [Candidatus Aminicenantes bacterium]|nr:hypothetical protein [Candidatus Aminicenantes bacterium]